MAEGDVNNVVKPCSKEHSQDPPVLHNWCGGEADSGRNDYCKTIYSHRKKQSRQPPKRWADECRRGVQSNCV